MKKHDGARRLMAGAAHPSVSLHICLDICQSNETQGKAAIKNELSQNPHREDSPRQCPGKALICGIKQKKKKKKTPGPQTGVYHTSVWRRLNTSHVRVDRFLK